jgi:hypothetical protein
VGYGGSETPKWHSPKKLKVTQKIRIESSKIQQSQLLFGVHFINFCANSSPIFLQEVRTGTTLLSDISSFTNPSKNHLDRLRNL